MEAHSVVVGEDSVGEDVEEEGACVEGSMTGIQGAVRNERHHLLQ